MTNCSADNVMTPHVLFLVGMPRSGTKLLRDMLNRHPDVALFPVESYFIPHFAKRLPEYGDLRDRRRFAAFFADFQRTIFFKNMASRNLPIDKDRWFANLDGVEYGDLLLALFRSYAQVTGCKIVGDKTPAYITEIPLILDNIPAARFVHIVRDPRDYVLSIRKAWNQDIRRATQLWKQSIRKLHDDLDRRHVKCCQVRYEDLLIDTRGSLDSICDHLGIAFCEDMMVLERPSENLGDTKDAATIVQTNFMKWQTQLSEAEVRDVESVAGSLMRDLDYEPRFIAGDSDVSSLKMNLLRVKDTWRRFQFVLSEEKNLTATLARMSRVGRF